MLRDKQVRITCYAFSFLFWSFFFCSIKSLNQNISAIASLWGLWVASSMMDDHLEKTISMLINKWASGIFFFFSSSSLQYALLFIKFSLTLLVVSSPTEGVQRGRGSCKEIQGFKPCTCWEFISRGQWWCSSGSSVFCKTSETNIELGMVGFWWHRRRSRSVVVSDKHPTSSIRVSLPCSGCVFFFPTFRSCCFCWYYYCYWSLQWIHNKEEILVWIWPLILLHRIEHARENSPSSTQRGDANWVWLRGGNLRRKKSRRSNWIPCSSFLGCSSLFLKLLTTNG